MNVLKTIAWTLTKDPYWVGPNAQQRTFVWKPEFIVETDCGFKVKYSLCLFLKRIDDEKFRDALMLEEGNQTNLLNDWHESVFLRKLTELNCTFKLLAPWNGQDYGNPCLCRTLKEGGEEFVSVDLGCRELEKELKSLPPFQKNGCEVEFIMMKLKMDGTTVKEDYDMLKVRGINTCENTKEFRLLEEAQIIIKLNREFEIERQFQNVQVEQEHDSEFLSISTKLVGRALEVTWRISGNGGLLRGYRKE